MHSDVLSDVEQTNGGGPQLGISRAANTTAFCVTA